MDSQLFVGQTLYHKTYGTSAVITEINGENLTVKLSKSIQLKNYLLLPKTHIGEWLFFDKEDINLSIDILATKPAYRKYKNKEILNAYIKTIKPNKPKLNFIDFLKLNHKFDGFHHYTDFENFVKIINCGKLLSRNKIQAKKTEFLDSANQDVIKKTPEEAKNHVRFFYKQNTPTLYSNEGIKRDDSPPHMPLPVLLLFDEVIITQPYCCFLEGGGGKRSSNITSNIEDAKKFNWDEIFKREPMPQETKVDMKNWRNAEFWVPKEITINYLKKIVFRSEADRKRAKLILDASISFIPLEVVSQKFNNNQNYLRDYKLTINQNQYNIVLKFYSSPDKYSHELNIKYADGISEKINILASDKIVISTPASSDIYRVKLIPSSSRVIEEIEYLMNGYISALWRNL